jgi:aspartyl-tRNA(Asn)/glutamyl-tRNA(Gln) amidotransferase subunit A
MAPPLADDRLYRVGAAVERELVAAWGGPLLNSIKEIAK